MCGPALFLYGFLFNSVRGRINAQLRRARAKARGAPVWTPTARSFVDRCTVRRHCNAAQVSLLMLYEWHRKTYVS